jgi:hypothetical protein
MATTLTHCPLCSEVSEHKIGEAREDENGDIFESSLTDTEALKQTNTRFKTHLLIDCEGSVTRSCAEGFIRQEILENDSPLSKLFSKRVRIKTCPICGLRTKSRLP